MKKELLTLSCILGNEEDVIERFVESFAPCVGRIVAVIAIGNQVPDQTQYLLRDKCAELGIHLSLDYYDNAPENDWPHVDNFAAARQAALDRASVQKCPYVMWADADDILESGSEAEILREVEEGKFDVLVVPYHVRGNRQIVNRERVFRNADVGRWRHACHELMDFSQKKEGVSYRILKEAVITHAPIRARKDHQSADRNRRILSGQVQDASRNYFFLHQEAFVMGKIEEARKWGKAALATAEERNLLERYETLLNLGQMEKDPLQAKAYASEAFSLMPDRREALALLATFKMIDGDNHAAQALAELMVKIPYPKRSYYSLNREWYEWKGFSLYTQTLRRTDQAGKALDLENELFRQNGAKISLLHATRGRPEKAIKAREDWLTLAADPKSIEHIFALDADDEVGLQAFRGFRHVVSNGAGPVAAWNAAAADSSGKVLLQLSDDWTPPAGWDRLILQRLGDLEKPSVLAINDNHRTDDLLCMAILTRPYYDRYGYLFWHEYFSMYSDNEFTAQAYRDGAVIEARDVVFHHAHPFFVGGDLDEIYRRSNSGENYRMGAEIFGRRNAVEVA